MQVCHAQVHTRVYTHVHARLYTPIHMSIYMCTHVYMLPVPRHVERHVYGHVHRHVHRHAHWHVYAHLLDLERCVLTPLRRALAMCTDMSARMAMPILLHMLTQMPKRPSPIHAHERMV